jgi:RNA 2',3'-cyclic 3'-phosphodiesterase
MPETKRTFLAVHFSNPIIEALARLQDRLKSKAGTRARIKWVTPGNIHVTLQFLGEVETGLLSALSGELEHAFTHIEAFDIEVAGVGAFPSPIKPRVVWAGVEKGQEELAALARQVQEATGALGFEPEKRSFRPHVTLGRVRDPRKTGELSSALDEFGGERIGECQIGEVALVASDLRPTGPVYTTLDSFPLGR